MKDESVLPEAATRPPEPANRWKKMIQLKLLLTPIYYLINNSLSKDLYENYFQNSLATN